MNNITTRLYQYALLMRWHKPIGFFLLLWPTLWALWLATKGIPNLKILLVFMGGVLLMRSAGCIINDFADRDFDPHVERTKQRPLATGKITKKEALILFGVLCFLAFALVLFLNIKTIALSVIAVLLAISYPFTKRYTYWPQLFLGLAFAWSIPMAFAAVTLSIPWQAWLLFLITTVWTLAYDTQYAMADQTDDVKIGIKSTAILFGKYSQIIVGFLQLLVLVGLFILGRLLQLHPVFFLFLSISTLSFGYQIYLLSKQTHPSNYLNAFLNNQWFGFIIFLGIFLNFWLKN